MFLNLITSFLGGSQVKMGIYLAIALLVSSAVGYHFWKVNSINEHLIHSEQEITILKQDLERSKANQHLLEASIREQNNSIGLLESQRKIDQEKLDQLSKRYDDSRGKVSELRKKLSAHDLNYLTLEKPGLIQRRINSGTSKIGKRLEQLTR
jgi:septal ring factor EnvC (AmiA/AmiB activator)